MGEPLRIIQVVVNMNRGGAETLLMNLYRNIDRSKVQFDFLTCKPGVFDQEITELGGIVYRIPYLTDIGHFGYKRALDEFFKEHADYKIIHSHMDKMSGLILKSAQQAGIPVRIAHSHNTRSEGSIPARLYKWYAGIQISTYASHFLACSNHAARWLFSGQHVSKAHILKNGIEGDRFMFNLLRRQQVREELGIAESSFVVGHVGRFHHQKNHAFLLERFAELSSQVDDSILLLAGDGPLRVEMEQLALQLKVSDKVKFLGVRSDIERLLQAFDVFVFPSFHEGLPVTLVEAQGAGLPCIISDSITREVDLGLGLIDFFSLHKPKDCLEKMMAVSQKTTNRLLPTGVLEQKGYDIVQTAGWLEAYYSSHYEVSHENTDGIYAYV